MKRLTRAELETLRLNHDWRALWVAAIPWVKFAATSIRIDNNEDMIQNALLDVGAAIPKWDPAISKFSTFIHRVARRRMLNFVRDKARVESKQQPFYDDDAHTDDSGEYSPQIQPTYGDSWHIPEGFRTAEEELARLYSDFSVERFLAELPDLMSLMVRESFGLATLETQDDEKRLTTFARERGVPRRTLDHQLERATTIMRTNQEAVYVTDTPSESSSEDQQSRRTHQPADRIPGFWEGGVARAMGDTDAWRESAGAVWKDWSWKPSDLDVMNGAKR